jgi:hypothetical protein
MKLAVIKALGVCVVAISCNFTSMLFAAENCRCPKNPGPGGGVQCAKDQLATCDPSTGECNCTCDSVQRGKTKEEYQSLIFSRVLNKRVEPFDMHSPEYQKLNSSFSKSESNGTFYLSKKAQDGRTVQVTIGVPEWLVGELRSPILEETESPIKLARLEGIILRSDKDKGTLTVRQRGSTQEKTVQYDSSTQWTSQEHHSKKINTIDASQVKDNDRVIVLGKYDKGVLHATLISKRLTN